MHSTIGSARAGLFGLVCLLGGLTGACGGTDHDSTERDTSGTCDNGAITAPGIGTPASGGGATSPSDPGSSGGGSTSGGSTSGGSTSGSSGGGSDGALCGPGASCRGITSCRNDCFGTECCVAQCSCGSAYPNSADARLTCSLSCSK